MDQRIDRSLDNLMQIIDENSRQILFLNTLVHRLLKGVSKTEPGTFCEALISPLEISVYLLDHDCDYLILVTQNSLPIIALDREEIDVMLENGKLTEWLVENWSPQTIAIAV